MPFLNGINWAVLMFYNGTNWLSYLNVRLFAPGWDLSSSSVTDKINSTSLRREGPAQRAQHSSLDWLKHICRDKSIPHMQYFATYDPMIWVSRSWDLTWPSQKDLWPLQWSFSRHWSLEKPLCACCAWANEGKWAATNSCPHQIPQTLLGGCRQTRRGDTDVTCLPCFCWQQLQTPHRCDSATKMR